MKFLLLVSLILSSHALHARVVLVTSFGPFQGRTDNGSKRATEALLQNHNGDGVTYVLCELPVEFETAHLKARECYEQMNPKPDMVISTGESNCAIKMETRVMNYENSTGADNSGVTRTDHTIDPNQTPYELSTLPVVDMLCSVEHIEDGAATFASTSNDLFVCNSTAYRLSRYMKEQNVPYGFIHVPKIDGCSSTPTQTADKLNTMIRTGISVLETNGPDGKLSCETHVPELFSAIAPLQAAVSAACQNEVSRQMLRVYTPPYGIVEPPSEVSVRKK